MNKQPEMSNNLILITGIRTPLAVKQGYKDMVGLVVQHRGNAYDGFTFKTPNGEVRDLIHYYHKPAGETT